MTGLLTGIEGPKKAKENIDAVLEFLLDETYTRADIIQKLLGYKHVRTAYKTLGKMEALELIKSAEFSVAGVRKLKLWGITTHGQGMAYKGKFTEKPAFQPAKIRLASLNHNLGLQQVRVGALKAGWSDWTRGGFKKKGEVSPDAVVTSPTGEKVAIELELSLKTLRRYRHIMLAHLKERKKGSWQQVWYVSEPNIIERVERAFASLDYIVIDGRKELLGDKYKQVFKFKELGSIFEEREEGVL